jgi:hypothetical protein
LLAVLEQKLLAGASLFSASVLGFLTVGIWYVDARIRANLMKLTEDLMYQAFIQGKPLIYNDADSLLVELREGRSLATSAAAIGRLAEQLHMTVTIPDGV